MIDLPPSGLSPYDPCALNSGKRKAEEELPRTSTVKFKETTLEPGTHLLDILNQLSPQEQSKVAELWERVLTCVFRNLDSSAGPTLPRSNPMFPSAGDTRWYLDRLIYGHGTRTWTRGSIKANCHQGNSCSFCPKVALQTCGEICYPK